jgi:hypothetical protein
MRARYQQFVDYFLEELAKAPNPSYAAEVAGMRCGWMYRNGYPMKRDAVAKKAERLLRRGDVTEAIRNYFSELADFSPVDGARKLVEHIHGIEHDATVLVDGSPVTYRAREKPSLDALKHYHALALPKAAKQVNVDQRVVVAKALISETPPPIRVRALEGEAKAAR